MSGSELVLCVRSSSVDDVIGEGLTPKSGEFSEIFKHEELAIISRKYAEKNEDYLQLIPSCVFRKPNGTILLYQRSKGTAESRLLGNYSTNVGGHTNILDVTLNNEGNVSVACTIWNNIVRETKEELGVDIGKVCELNYDDEMAEFHGFIYDSSNAVGRVHLGLVFVFDVQDDLEFDSSIAEQEGMILKGWHKPEVLLYNHDIDAINLENWATIVCKYLVK